MRKFICPSLLGLVDLCSLWVVYVAHMSYIEGATGTQRRSKTMTAQRDYTTTGEELLSTEGRKVAFRSCGGRCPCCGKQVSRHGRKADQLTVDHLQAHANGGSNGIDNMVILCGSCNSSKGDSNLSDWLPARILKLRRVKSIRGARTAAKRWEQRILASSEQLAADLRDAGVEG